MAKRIWNVRRLNQMEQGSLEWLEEVNRCRTLADAEVRRRFPNEAQQREVMLKEIEHLTTLVADLIEQEWDAAQEGAVPTFLKRRAERTSRHRRLVVERHNRLSNFLNTHYERFFNRCARGVWVV